MFSLYIKRRPIFLILLFCPLFALAEGIMSAGTTTTDSLLLPPKTTPHAGKAKGIIVKFKRWPTEKETALILQKTGVAPFQKQEKLEFMMTSIWTWSEWKSAEVAQSMCESLSRLPFVEYCEIDSELSPHQQTSAPSENPNLDPFSQTMARINSSLLDHSEDSLSSSVLLNQPISSFSSTNTGDLKTCGIVPHQMSLKSGKLSDYWAQEMIGSDLARELFATAPSPQKKLVAVMDVSTNDHDAKVKNLITGNNRHAVLPALGANAPIYSGGSASLYPQKANTLLGEVRTQCGSEPTNNN